MSSDKLRAARAAKNDEFYTQYGTISDELSHYREQMKDQIVYCNCDDPSWSNFWRYFHNNFASLGLKRLISTHYAKDSNPSYALIYEGGNDLNMDAGQIVPLQSEGDYHAGDFRSQSCVKYLKQVDIVATNPPFSLFRAYIEQLFKFNKKFIILGSISAAAYKEVFPLLKDNKMWAGYSFNKTFEMRMPDSYELKGKAYIAEDGSKHGFVPAMAWYTNLDVKKRHDGLWHRNGEFDQTQAHSYYEGHEGKYPHYYNFDGIDVASCSDIPIDYPGYMGVPITIFDKLNPKEIEIIGLGSGYLGQQIGVTGINPEHKKMMRGHSAAGDLYYVVDGKPKIPYIRVIIRNRHPIAKADDKGY